MRSSGTKVKLVVLAKRVCKVKLMDSPWPRSRVCVLRMTPHLSNYAGIRQGSMFGPFCKFLVCPHDYGLINFCGDGTSNLCLLEDDCRDVLL